MNKVGRDGTGPAIVDIPDDRFRAFAKLHATSPEVGPINTYLDHDVDRRKARATQVFGLEGCGKLCAVVCTLLYPSIRDNSILTLKLDSVIVDPALRRRGLAGLLVTKLFTELLGRADLDITRIYAHSVHPATVSMLRRLGFQDPLPMGAPISHLKIEKAARAEYISKFDGATRARSDSMKLQCELCSKKHKTARPWCLPRDT